ncbi:MAG: DUF2490 domain-containing protein [Vicingus serpentipes]|nr:DUF2490 domain-containing protein [Vicingus serpentipes]
MKKNRLLLWFILTGVSVNAQITPAGFDHTRLVGWEAVGIHQALTSSGDKTIFAYIGIGTESRPDDFNLLERPGIFVSDQKFQHRFHPHFKYNIGLSYRSQHHYAGQLPYEHESPGKVNEIRTYSTLAWITSLKKLKWEISFKEEWRNFFTTENEEPQYPIKLRSRLKSKWKWSLDQQKKHSLIFQTEVLFSLGKGNSMDTTWSKFHYTDCRLSAFYTYTFDKHPLVLEIGYMNELRGVEMNEDISVIAVNLIWINPFKNKKNED